MIEAEFYERNKAGELVSLNMVTWLPPFEVAPDILASNDQVYVKVDQSTVDGGIKVRYVRGIAFKVADQYLAAAKPTEDQTNGKESSDKEAATSAPKSGRKAVKDLSEVRKNRKRTR